MTLSKHGIRLICLLCVCALLTGCGASEKAGSGATLPPAPRQTGAPENDAEQTYSQSVALYLPSRDGTRLLAVPETAELSLNRPTAQTLSELLLSHPGTETAAPLGGDVALRLSDTEAVEVSGRVATVSLGASALRLSHEELFTVGQALANTLCQFGDLEYVNVLIAGVQPGLDIAATLPAGCFQRNTQESLGTLWARASAQKTASRRAFTAALYYPAAAGKGILCEARTLALTDLDAPALIRALLSALSAGPEALPAAPSYPDLTAQLSAEPEIREEGGQRRAVLQFSEELNQQLIGAGITRSVMAASLVTTLTTFIPGLDGVEMTIGTEKIVSLTPSGTLLRAGETLFFSDGLMKRGDFSFFLLDYATLYFAGGDGKLQRVSRPVPYYAAANVRALVDQWIAGPQSYDSPAGLSPVAPQGLRDADLLGAAYKRGVLLLNFSAQLQALSQGMDAAQERLMIYSLVNTLCALRGVTRVALFVMGEQPDSLAGAVYLPGEFLPNLDLAH